MRHDMTSYETLLLSQPVPHVLQITLNRPEAANAFNTQMALDLVSAFEAVSMDAGDTRAIILTGSGTRAFCAGGDLKERNGMSNAAWGKQHLIYERMARAVINCPIPIIGAINGAAYGGGCELAAAVDFAYVAEGAKFAQTEVKIGIIPGAGGTQTLPRAIGERRAKELILTGQVFNAQQALEWGSGQCSLSSGRSSACARLRPPKRSQPMPQWQCGRLNRRFPKGQVWRWPMGWPSRLKPTTAPSQPKTAERASWPLTKNAPNFTGQ